MATINSPSTCIGRGRMSFLRLANSPKIVLADEPTGNLDYRTSGEALVLIRDICSENNASLLLVSHEQRVLDDFGNVKSLSDINCTSKS